MRLKLAHLVLTALFCVGVLAACDDACSDLSERICSCEATQNSQRACLQRLDQRSADRNPTAQDLEQCNALIDTCSCEQLADGNYAACGLAVE